MTPYMMFEFADQDGNKRPLLFQHPESLIIAEHLDEVETAFEEAETRLEQGYYVAGYVSYEAAPAFDSAFHSYSPDWPLVWFGVFKEPSSAVLQADGEFTVSSWEMDGNFQSYQSGIDKIKKAIEQGDTYQVNYTTRLTSNFSGDGYSFYKQLANNQQSAYGAYLHLDNRSILSASPELFFRINQGKLTTKPMKGTAKRGRWFQEDEQRKNHLLASEKEQAENLMIVDLLRNDLGRIAVPGSVNVPQLFEVETYPTVHQMTSTVQADVPADISMFEVFRALFPCGSITGAPKIRTMKYIRELETSPRNVYCGAVGYMTPNKEAVFNVPIRTVMIDHGTGKAVYGTGGGITWDSTSTGEYNELQTKARLLTEQRPNFDLLETMKLEDGQIPLLDSHLKRLSQSGCYFNYQLCPDQLRDKLESLASQHTDGTFKIRMLVCKEGDADIQITPLNPTPESVSGMLAASPVDERNPFLFHKTTHREVYDQHHNSDVFSVLLWNRKGELTEFTIANLVVKDHGKYYTPPVSCGLLAGTYRGYLLGNGKIEEKVLYKKDVFKYDEVWMVNGVRGWIRVDMGKTYINDADS